MSTSTTRGAASGARRAFEFQLLRYRRTWRGSIAGTLLNPLFFLGALGIGLGHFVDRNGAVSALGGRDYLSYLAPGLLASTAMQVGMGEAAWPILGGVLWTKDYLAMINTPLEVTDVMLGHLAFIAMRITTAVGIFLAAMAAFGTWHSPLALLAWPAATLTGLSFVTPLAAFSVTREEDNAFTWLFRFFVTPVFLFSGAFFPISQLPSALQTVAKLTPLWHGVELCRALTLGRVHGAGALVHVVVLAAYVTVGLILSRRGYRARLAR